MRETDDPRVALHGKSLPKAAAAARDLGRMGTWDDVPGLLDVANTHRRTGLRLAAAAAAADILHRYRTGAAGTLPPGARDTILDWSKRTDPGYNPSALMVLAAFPESAVIDRLGRLMRDPRADVRAGAGVAIRRMALSHTDLSGGPLRRAVGAWLTHRKTPADSLTELVRLVGDLGWSEHRQAALDAAGTSAPVTEAVETASARLTSRAEAASWDGLWVSDGLDVFEQDEADRSSSWLLVGEGTASLDGKKPVPAKLTDEGLSVKKLGTLRMVWAPRLTDPESVPVLQGAGRSWYAVTDPAAVLAWLEQTHPDLSAEQAPANAGLLRAFDDAEGAAADRGRAIARLVVGDVDGALAALASLTTGKRPRADLYYWLGRAHQAAGSPADARDAYAHYLERAGKKAVFRSLAEAALDQLGGA